LTLSRVRCQRVEPELSKSFLLNVTSVQLLDPSDDVTGDGVRELWLSRETAVSSVVIAEHGSARGVIQFSVARVSCLFVLLYGMISVDMLTCARQMTEANLIWHMEPEKQKSTEIIKNKNSCVKKKWCWSGVYEVSPVYAPVNLNSENKENKIHTAQKKRSV